MNIKENRKQGKGVKIISLLIVLLVCGYLLLDVGNSKASTIDENEVLKEYIRVQADAGEMSSQVENSPYAELYRSIEELKLAGKNESEAMREAQREYTEKKALCWYAEQKGLSVTKAEVLSYMNNIINEAKTASNYEDISKACKAENTSFEETIYNNEELYGMRCLINKLYEDEYQRFSGNEELNEMRYEEWNNEWEKIVTQAINSYKATTQFAKVKVAVSESCKLIQKEELHMSAIKRAKIFY